MPDTPQRIATDTSQKIPVRFGETLKSYKADPKLDAASLKAIPLVLAAWLRYLLAIDDNGKAIEVSADPMLAQLQGALKSVKFGQPDSASGVLKPILSNANIFGVDLYEIGLASKVEEIFKFMLTAGGVRAALKKYL